MSRKVKHVSIYPVPTCMGFAFQDLEFRYLSFDNIKTGWLDWLNNPKAVEQLNRDFEPETEETLRNYLRGVWSNGDFFFAVYDNNSYIGNVKMFLIDRENRSFSFGRLVGNTAIRGAGIGQKMTEFVCAFGCYYLDLTHIWTEVFDNNLASIVSNERAGLQVREKYRNSYNRNGIEKNVVMMEATLEKSV